MLFLGDTATAKRSVPAMSHVEYDRWFRDHRAKKKALPVFNHSDNKTIVLAKETAVRTRQFAIDSLVRLGLK